MSTSATTAAAASLISLQTVANELSFIANYLRDLNGKTASDADKTRLTSLLAQAKSDLDTAADRAAASLGQGGVIE